MKNLVKLFGIIAFVALIGFSMIACDNDTTGGQAGYNPTGGGASSLSGRYSYSYSGSDLYISFTSGGSFTGYVFGYALSGTYRFDGRNITLSRSDFYGSNWTYVNSTTIRDGQGDLWYK